jgi:hypothetical protein
MVLLLSPLGERTKMRGNIENSKSKVQSSKLQLRIQN